MDRTSSADTPGASSTNSTPPRPFLSMVNAARSVITTSTTRALVKGRSHRGRNFAPPLLSLLPAADHGELSADEKKLEVASSVTVHLRTDSSNATLKIGS